MSIVGWIILAAIVVAVVILFFIYVAKQYRKVGPNEVLIISGGRRHTVTEPDGTKRKIGYRMHIGGGTFVTPFIEKAEVLPLEVFTLNMEIPESLTAKGIIVRAVGQAQVKVRSDEHSIRIAAEQFLGKGLSGMKDIAQQILEGSMRGILGSLTVEQIYQNREEFGKKVLVSAAQPFESMGLTILSFALRELSDSQGYLEALGMPHIARVKGEAETAQAEANKDAIVKAAQARKEGDIAKFQAEAEIAKASRDYELSRAAFQADISQKRAKADAAYDLERLKVTQDLKREEYEVRRVEKEQAIKVEELEIVRKDKELQSTVMKVAEAMKQQSRIETEAEAFRLETLFKGKMAAKRSEGMVDADVIKAKGEAEAEAMAKKAAAMENYNQAALYQMYMQALPEIARAVSEPLSKVDKIIMVGNGADGVSKLTGQVASVMAQLPTVIESLSGIDLKELIKNWAAKQGPKKAE
jgi:flotillin